MSSNGRTPEWGEGDIKAFGDDQRALEWTPAEAFLPGVRFTLSGEDEPRWLSRDEMPSICGFHSFASGHRSILNGALDWSLSYGAIAREVDFADWLQAIAVSSDEVWLNRFEKGPDSSVGIAAWSSNPRNGLLCLRVLIRDGAHLFLLRFAGNQSTGDGWSDVAVSAMSGFQLLGAPAGTLCESVRTEKFGPRDAWSFQRFASWNCTSGDGSETLPLSPLCTGLVRLDGVTRGRAIGSLRLGLWPMGSSAVELWQHYGSMLRRQGFSVSSVSFRAGAPPRPWRTSEEMSLTLCKGGEEFDIEFHVLGHQSGSLAILGCGPGLRTNPEWWAIHRRAMRLLLESSTPRLGTEGDREADGMTDRAAGGASSLSGASSLGGAASLGRQTDRPMERAEPIKSEPAVRKADQTSLGGMSLGGSRTAAIGVPGDGGKGTQDGETGEVSIRKDSAENGMADEDKDKAAKAFVPPVAIILRADHRSEPGAKNFLVGMGTHLVFRCGSYDPDDRNDGSPTPENITRRGWTLRSPDGSVRSLGSSPLAENPAEVTFTATRAGTYKLRLEVGDDDADGHRKGQAEVSITVVGKCPVPKIQLPLDFIPITRRFNSAIPVVGDHIVAHSLSHDQGMPSGKGISGAQWRVEPASSAMVLHSDKDRITFVPEEEGLYMVFLRVINEDGVTSSDEAMVGQAISVPMTPENLAAVATEKIGELGFEAGVAALFALGGEMGVPVALLLTLSTKAVDEGIKRMGLHPIIAIAIAGGFRITSYGKVFWNINIDTFYRPFKDLLAERIAGIRAFKLIDENSRDTHAKFAKDAAAQASLEVAWDFFRKKAMEQGIKVDGNR